ncbi:hypothetical protein DPMN_035145 [Dreissena polymorpha]|uniref:Uncharacterized protein n=1 Tax=Dreissena polymorpha TaxID=45954 RepID=A0A9D4M8Z4_DREPO|nr:hypothetical protein DPMN_035145 [Dreissena polymorpha]
MAPDTKVSDGQSDGQHQNNIPLPLAGDNKIHNSPDLLVIDQTRSTTEIFTEEKAFSLQSSRN